MPKVTEAHVEARRRQILEAACRCFVNKGFHQSTIRDICKEAKLSAGAVYGYFSGKDEIIEGLAELGRQNTRNFLESIAPDGPARAALEQRLAACVEYVRSDVGRGSSRLDLGMWGEALHTPQIRSLWLQALPNAVEPFAEVVRRGHEQGEVPGDLDPQAVGTLCVALCLGLNVLTALGPDDVLDGCSEAIPGLLHGLGPSPPEGPRLVGRGR